MYNRNCNGFDYPPTGSGQAQANPLGIAKVGVLPKIK